MYIRNASSPSTVFWAFHTIQPSSLTSCHAKSITKADLFHRSPFLLIGLKKQLAKTDNFSLTITHSAYNFTFSDPVSSHLSPNSAIIIFVSFVVSAFIRCILIYLDPKTVSTIVSCILHYRPCPCSPMVKPLGRHVRRA